ncbi:hypothetical protein E3N88_24084 [Mikania micrantha]|uniref:Uncharacterized protein n=1 Tax=Mikania micrantha TaxID=192012 RepID=A0A5N6NGW2_9ASTR|nr:hypothetical protein E3N88_24084 [Mikania micrantha]
MKPRKCPNQSKVVNPIGLRLHNFIQGFGFGKPEMEDNIPLQPSLNDATNPNLYLKPTQNPFQTWLMITRSISTTSHTRLKNCHPMREKEGKLEEPEDVKEIEESFNNRAVVIDKFKEDMQHFMVN